LGLATEAFVIEVLATVVLVVALAPDFTLVVVEAVVFLAFAIKWNS
jgi:hypothetical protein